MSDEANKRSARVLLAALDVFEAATSAVSAPLAVPRVRAVVETLDDDQLRAVAVALAVEGVWSLPPALVTPRTASEIRSRVGQVRRWVERMRLEASWAAS